MASGPTWHAQAREALRGAAKEKSSALAAALEARDAARMKAAVGEERAARVKEDLERYLAAAKLRASAAEVGTLLHQSSSIVGSKTSQATHKDRADWRIEHHNQERFPEVSWGYHIV